ncbi:rCG57820 [Rattus norvegicus]|uniref:RCG57820 n=1 Tax=Rattus norvegicus TaxID=10116 RepID=A6J480_RAT|nr:rCG57820 [Rattus norvegicus]
MLRMVLVIGVNFHHAEKRLLSPLSRHYFSLCSYDFMRNFDIVLTHNDTVAPHTCPF